MAIWLRAREEFADNRFQLLFIYIDDGHYGPIIHVNPISFSILYCIDWWLREWQRTSNNYIYISIAYRHNCYVYSCVYITSL